MKNKLCVFCKHFNLSMGTSDYSDFTPGTKAVLECEMGIWSMQNDNNFDENEEFRRNIKRAETCEEYEVSK